ncbi:Acg family FMN-binding oxidoreductase [Pseudonocardia acidicola]|uniref:NAD(P)H nitroreductase n=1 Tax=Pseudonocardia acidicola TaxID=2724939 RepID=A0ABX1SFJ7_9PSEU|nr:nitroreductase family protein [Pseudonocardia acidicola]NMI00326.1 NAD(P)H nitroreductase [Pseudonocardia acidicola]
MIVETVDRDTVRAALELACRAPSVHNSQPWRWRLGESRVDLYADLRRWLPATDPDGRDLLLSCGAVLHHLRLALGSLGVGAQVHRFPDPVEPDLLATVELSMTPTDPDEPELVLAMNTRRTDRRRFGAWPVPATHLDRLVARAAEQGAVLRVVSDAAVHHALVAAIAQAAELQAAVPGYETEIGVWSGARAASDGVPAGAVPRDPTRSEGPPMRRFADADLDEPRGDERDAAALLVLGTSSDDRLSQLRAGEAMSAVLLEATALELASSPLSQPLEITGTRERLGAEVLRGTLSPQLVFRVGWPPAIGPAPARTPRRPLYELLEPIPG